MEIDIANLTLKSAGILFGMSIAVGLLVKRLQNVIKGMIIAMIVAIILLVIVSKNPVLHLDKDVIAYIMGYYYHLKSVILSFFQQLANSTLNDLKFKVLAFIIAGAGFGIGFVLLGKYYADARYVKKYPTPKK